MAETSRPSLRELVLVPAIITLAVTVLRLIGELQGWSPVLFSRAGGGGGAIVGITWLPFVFGIYFAWRLVKAGEAPASAGRAIGMAVLAVVIVPATIFTLVKLNVRPIGQIAVVCLVFLIVGVMASRGWTALGRVLFAYALAARVPVAALMLPAIIGQWGTHYDALPPNFPTMGPVATWALVGLYPQLTLWVGFTLVIGMLVGSITAAILRARRPQAVASAA